MGGVDVIQVHTFDVWNCEEGKGLGIAHNLEQITFLLSYAYSK